jgi:hypothetical protein
LSGALASVYSSAENRSGQLEASIHKGFVLLSFATATEYDNLGRLLLHYIILYGNL